MTDPVVSLPFTPLERAVYFPAANALVLTDVHFGRGTVSSVEAPIGDGTDAIDRLRGLLERERGPVETVVVAGDLLHSFSRVPRGVTTSVLALTDAVAAANATLVLTRGNHDTMLEEVLERTRAAGDGDDHSVDRVTLADEYRLADDETVVLHGHEPPSSEADRYVVGHDHPALSIDGRKRPCFLYGPDTYDGADVLVLPAFTRLAPGSTVNGMRARDFQTPLVSDADRFHPGVRDPGEDETLWFPPLGECRRLL